MRDRREANGRRDVAWYVVAFTVVCGLSFLGGQLMADDPPPAGEPVMEELEEEMSEFVKCTNEGNPPSSCFAF